MNNPHAFEDVLLSTRDLLAQLLALPIEKIAADASVTEDLGADSLDIVDLSFQLGRRYGCSLPKISVLGHAEAAYGDIGAFVQDGRLTEAGLDVLCSSLYAYGRDQLSLDMHPSEVFAATTVRNWAHLCHRLFDHLPAACPECGGTHAHVNDQHRAVCTDCSALLSPSDGDDVARALVDASAQRARLEAA